MTITQECPTPPAPPAQLGGASFRVLARSEAFLALCAVSDRFDGMFTPPPSHLPFTLPSSAFLQVSDRFDGTYGVACMRPPTGCVEVS